MMVWVSPQGSVVVQAVRDCTLSTVQAAADLAVHAGSRLDTDSVSRDPALTGSVHEFVKHTRQE
jgi:hypothetical protein